MVEFIKSPVGQYHLAYSIGDTASFKGELEKELIDKGYAVEISEKANEGNTRGLQPDDTIPSGSEAVSVGNDRGDGSGQHNHKPNPRKRSRN